MRIGAVAETARISSLSITAPRSVFGRCDRSNTMYVEELIGPETVDTIPPATLAAFREHGEVRRSLDEDIAGARRQLRELAEVGVDLRAGSPHAIVGRRGGLSGCDSNVW